MRKSKLILIILSAVITMVMLAYFIWTPIQEKSKPVTDHTTRLISKNLTQSKVSPKLPTHIQTSQTFNPTIESSNQQRDTNIQNILNKPELEGAIVGLSLRDAETGSLLYEHLGETHMRPASNLKLLTAAAAFDVLGPDYEFTTSVLTDGDIKKDTLKGNLYIKGQGDPTLLKADLDRFASDLKEKGITKVTGDLIADDTWYDDVRYSQDLNWTDEFFYTGAQVSALTISPNDDYNTGTIIVRVYPGDHIGDEPEVVIEPETDYVHITNNAQTDKYESENDITVEREHGTNELIVSGSIPKGSVTEVWRSVWEPSKYVLDIFQTSLAEQNIQLSKDSRMRTQKTPKGAELLLTKQSMPLKDIMVPFMKLSNNGHGEMLVKEMGQVVNGEGSWDEGLQVMETSLEKQGMNTDNVLLRDGSGMSHKNLVSPNALTNLLFQVQNEDWFGYFKDAQPIAGETDPMVGGTLSYRMMDEPLKGNVKAKTGTLNGISTLSGYLVNEDGEERIFSIMINNYIDGYMPSIEDEIVERLME